MFKVPERSRDTKHPQLGSTSRDGNNGAFYIDSVEPGWMLALICSDGEGWEHVSVHAYRGGRTITLRTPTWREMVFVKGLCWDDPEVMAAIGPTVDAWEQGALETLEPEHFCIRCHHRWTGDSKFIYCGDCHRDSLKAIAERDAALARVQALELDVKAIAAQRDIAESRVRTRGRS